MHDVVHPHTLTDIRAARKRYGAKTSAIARWSIVLAALFAGIAGAATAATQEQVGSWIINCPGEAPKSGSCLMHSNSRFLDKAGITGDLEVRVQGGILVPVIALRGVSAEILMAASLIGKTEASIRFQGGVREELRCAAGAVEYTSPVEYVCAPNQAEGAKLAAWLPSARAAIVRVAIAVAAMKPLPVLEKSLELSGTNEALARLRTLGPTQVPSQMTALAARSPSALMRMADRALKAAGYPNGVAQLQALLAKYLSGP